MTLDRHKHPSRRDMLKVAAGGFSVIAGALPVIHALEEFGGCTWRRRVVGQRGI